jgi:hypothetical protein
MVNLFFSNLPPTSALLAETKYLIHVLLYT